MRRVGAIHPAVAGHSTSIRYAWVGDRPTARASGQMPGPDEAVSARRPSAGEVRVRARGEHDVDEQEAAADASDEGERRVERRRDAVVGRAPEIQHDEVRGEYAGAQTEEREQEEAQRGARWAESGHGREAAASPAVPDSNRVDNGAGYLATSATTRMNAPVWNDPGQILSTNRANRPPPGR